VTARKLYAPDGADPRPRAEVMVYRVEGLPLW
jgi:hypothetical protein